MTRRLLQALAVAAGIFAISVTSGAQTAGSRHWVGTWATAPMPMPPEGLYSIGFNNQTLRQIVRISLGGSEFRIRLANTYGTKDVPIGSVHVGLRAKGAAIKPESDRTVT